MRVWGLFLFEKISKVQMKHIYANSFFTLLYYTVSITIDTLQCSVYYILVLFYYTLYYYLYFYSTLYYFSYKYTVSTAVTTTIISI